MKKISLKKIGIASILVAIVAVFSAFFMLSPEAETSAPSSFVANGGQVLGPYVDNYYFATKLVQGGGYAYCTDIHKSTPHGVTMTLSGEASPGIAYILTNGFPQKSITGNNDYDYYITQMAIWRYLDETTGTNNLPKFNTSTDPYGLRQHIINLVNGAKSATSYATPSLALNINSTSLNLSSDKNYYESNVISVNAVSVSGNYNVAIEGAPAGTQIVNSSNNVEQSSFNVNESFRIRIPVSSVTDSNYSIKVTATATGLVNKAYLYKSSVSTVQDVYGSVLYPETTALSAETTVTLATSKVSIVKIDATTGDALSGATFQLLDNQGKLITEWVSTENYHVIKNLPNGTYTLKEVEAPDGYIISKDTVTIEINDQNRDVVVKMENQPIEKEVSILKVDKNTGEPLAGARIVVENEAGEKVAEFVSTTSPYVLDDLGNGTYKAYETEAPDGYEKSDEVYTFTIDDEHPNAQVIIENVAIDKVVNILKIDKNTGKPLAGAHIVVENEDGDKVADFVSTTSPYVLKDIEDGTYKAYETEAPEGYQKSDEVYTITISDENPTAQVTIENIKEVVEVPNTSSDSSIINTIFGALILFSGIGFVRYNGKKQRS